MLRSACFSVCCAQVNTFGVGELVKVLEDMESVKRLQTGHGEWTDSMSPVRSLPSPLCCWWRCHPLISPRFWVQDGDAYSHGTLCPVLWSWGRLSWILCHIKGSGHHKASPWQAGCFPSATGATVLCAEEVISLRAPFLPSALIMSSNYGVCEMDAFCSTDIGWVYII